MGLNRVSIVETNRVLFYNRSCTNYVSYDNLHYNGIKSWKLIVFLFYNKSCTMFLTVILRTMGLNRVLIVETNRVFNFFFIFITDRVLTMFLMVIFRAMANGIKSCINRGN